VTAQRIVAEALLRVQAAKLVTAGRLSESDAAGLLSLLEPVEVTLARTTLLPALTHAGRELMSRTPEFCQESWR
jgi:hypothetical protein